MSNIIETQTIVDGSRHLVIRAHIDGDGSGQETYTTLIDASSYTPAFTKVSLMRLDSNLIGFSAELTLEGTPVASGTTDGTTANKLVDTGASFDTDGTAVGMLVYNSTDGTTAEVIAIDSGTTLSINADIFVSGEAYEIGGKEHIWSLPDYQQNQCFKCCGGIPNSGLTTPLGDISISTTGLGAGDTGHIMLYFKKRNNV